MKTIILTLLFILLTESLSIAQVTTTEMTPENSTVFNRKVAFENGVTHLDIGDNAGIVWLNNFEFGDGTIELDIKGRNAPGQSFVGLAFNGKDNQTYDAVYFRPFNFKNPDRKKHAIQYISLPQHDWPTLREEFPGKYENKMQPVPENVEDWIHAKIEVHRPQVKVYVNGSDKPALEVDLISEAKQGKVGFWVGNGSEGWFRNLKIEKQ